LPSSFSGASSDLELLSDRSLTVAIGHCGLLLMVLGALGTFVFAPQLVVVPLGDSALGPMAPAGPGIALIVVAIATVRTVERSTAA
jgi:hypothetical protein